MTTKASRREWIALSVIALPCIFYAMDLTVLDLALPRISAELRPRSGEMLWIVDIYGFMVAGWLITMGTIGDRIGRRRLLMIGAATFAIASVAAAFSTSAPMLIATRAILGLAGATLAPSTLSLIRNMFLDADERTMAIGIWVTSYSIGGALGPVVGGLLLERFWWGSVFLAATPAMALLLIAGPFVLPEFRIANARSIDLVSVAESLIGVLAIVYGLKRIAENGAHVAEVASIVAGVAVGFLFVRRQRTLKDPLIDLNLFRRWTFNMPLAAYLIATFMAFGAFLFSAQYLQLVLGLSALHAGMWLLPSFAGYIIGSMVTPAIAARIPRRFLMTGSLVVTAAGFALLADVQAGGAMLLAIATFIYSIGLAPVVTLATDAVVGAAPVANAGIASAISETSSELGGALGIAVLGSIGAAIYRSGVGSVMSGRLSPAATEAAKATLGGAVALSSQLSADDAATLLRVAREAFLHSFVATAMICAALALLTAVAIFIVPEHDEEIPVVLLTESL